MWGSLQLGLVIRALAGARMAEGGWQFGGALDIAGVLAFVVVTVTPFNLVKGALSGTLTFLVYKRISAFLKNW